MSNQEIVEILGRLRNSKTAILSSKIALGKAIDAVNREKAVNDALVSEIKRAIHLNETVFKGTPSEDNIKAYVCGLQYAGSIIIGEKPNSMLPTDEQIREVIERVKREEQA